MMDQSKYFMNEFLCILREEFIPENRVLIEWIIIKLLIQFPECFPLFWEVLKTTVYKSNVTTSLLCISFHVTPHLHFNHQKNWLTSLFDSVLPWVSSNHFNIRLLAQYSLRKAWIYITELPELSVYFSSYRHIQLIVNFIETNSECKGNMKKCDETYMYGSFNPLRDLSIDFLFHQLPVILKFPHEAGEIIPFIAFQKFETNFGWLIATGYDESKYLANVIDVSCLR